MSVVTRIFYLHKIYSVVVDSLEKKIISQNTIFLSLINRQRGIDKANAITEFQQIFRHFLLQRNIYLGNSTVK